MRIAYVALIGAGMKPDQQVMDVIDWPDPDAMPTYETGKARAFVEAKSALLGRSQVREMLAGGWSNGYVLTRAAVSSDQSDR